MKELTKKQARQFILAKQGLLGNYRFYKKEGVLSYIRQAGCIQYDPVDICGKNAELTIRSRVKGFRKDMLNDLLYKERKLIDYVDKELSIWPIEDWPYFSNYRDFSMNNRKNFPGLDKLIDEAIAYIRNNGPVSSDSLPIEGEIFWHSSMHWSGDWQKKSKAARSVLEQLYTDGVLVIHHKNGSRKYYDLAERHLDSSIINAPNPCKDKDDLLCWRVLRRIGAVGLLWNKNSTAFLGINMDSEARKHIFSLLEKEGKILPVHIEDIKATFYYLKEDEALMESVLNSTIDSKARMEFIAPLDPFLWDKKLIDALWDFSYSWEIYTPQNKRKYGYYTLPILWGEKFIGRIETAVDRKSQTLSIKNIWYEDGIRHTKKLKKILINSINHFARFNDCTQIEFTPQVLEMIQSS